MGSEGSRYGRSLTVAPVESTDSRYRAPGSLGHDDLSGTDLANQLARRKGERKAAGRSEQAMRRSGTEWPSTMLTISTQPVGL